MNWPHLKTMLWLRVCLFRNGLRRSGISNTIITFVLIASATLASVSMFFCALILGAFMLPHANANHLLLLWNGAVIAFLFFWAIGLVTELQRSEVLSIDKMLHFPISVSGTFLINYVSAFASASILSFVPPMFALCAASVFALGPTMIVTFPLVVGFVLMVTSLTYQFRGWLASMMVNKRRRQVIISMLSLGIILLLQLPNLLNLTFMGSRSDSRRQEAEDRVAETNQIVERLRSGEIDSEKFNAELQRLQQESAAKQEAIQQEKLDAMTAWVARVDMVLPPGWLPYAVMQARENNVLPGILASLGFFAISAVSLRRSYRTTLKYYRGEIGNPKSRPKKKVEAVTGMPAGNMLERDLRWLPEEAAVCALGTTRTMMRAPEVKMLLLTPLLISGVFFIMHVVRSRGGSSPPMPDAIRPVMSFGVIVMVSFCLAQLVQNQFGFDRDGFRAYVLSPARRRNILLGKNLAVLPLMIGMGVIGLTVLQFLYPVGILHYVSSVVELLSLFCILCIFGNYAAILSPLAVRSNSLRASSVTFTMVLLRFAFNMLMMTAFVPLMLPLGIDALLQLTTWGRAIPARLILSTLEFSAIALIYRLVLNHQGTLLQSREQKILDVVTVKND